MIYRKIEEENLKKKSFLKFYFIGIEFLKIPLYLSLSAKQRKMQAELIIQFREKEGNVLSNRWKILQIGGE